MIKRELLSHFTFADGVLIFLIILIIIISALIIYKNGHETEWAVIKFEDNTETISLEKDQIYELDNGMVIEVKGGKIRVKDSDCPQKICVKHGWLKFANDVIVCLPNETIIYLKKKSDLDYITR
ncbi:MAG: NusG domain II-containing protein [Candidatus Cloacimonetes bacterium]|nr:NusG domain II-containing protein [Candidatus Cloacimonadota bacterium]